jgi:hypothetical protein
MLSKANKISREERERLLVLKHKFENRITVAKFGKEALDQGDYSNAVRRFGEYMETMAEIKGVKDFYALRLSHFDPKKDLTELMMMSHIYLEMARIYDAVPKYEEESKKCLDQFVHFSANQPYQVVNSELIRKQIKKSAFKHPEVFRHAHSQIFVQSKKCFVVTFCFGNDHVVTQDYRRLKDWLLERRWGLEMVQLYYRLSSEAVPRWSESKVMCFVGRYLLSPALALFSKTLLRFIIGK